MGAARNRLNLIRGTALKVYFQDEGRFGRISDPVRCWAPKSVRPLLGSQLIREYIYVYSAMCPDDGDVFNMILPYANTCCMNHFLKGFEAYREGEASLMIMDQASWHTTDDLAKPAGCTLDFQPPYSPELNPVEHYWRYLRERYTHNREWESLDELEHALLKALQASAQDKKSIQSLAAFSWLDGLCMMTN